MDKCHVKHNLTGYPQKFRVFRAFGRNPFGRLALWSAILSVSSAVLSCCCLILTVLFARRAHRDSARLAPGLRSALSQMQSLQESHELLTQELARLANRVKMQRVRNVTEHGLTRSGDGMPDPVAQPTEWRAAMNRKLAEAKTGVKL